MTSLQEQFLKAGLVDKKKVKQVNQEKSTQKKQERRTGTQSVDEVRLAALLDAPAPSLPAPPLPDELPADHAQLEGFFAQLAQTLEEIDFHKGRAPESAMRKLRRLFLRSELSVNEIRLLRGVLADAQRMARLASGRLSP